MPLLSQLLLLSVSQAPCPVPSIQRGFRAAFLPPPVAAWLLSLFITSTFPCLWGTPTLPAFHYTPEIALSSRCAWLQQQQVLHWVVCGCFVPWPQGCAWAVSTKLGRDVCAQLVHVQKSGPSLPFSTLQTQSCTSSIAQGNTSKNNPHMGYRTREHTMKSIKDQCNLCLQRADS